MGVRWFEEAEVVRMGMIRREGIKIDQRSHAAKTNDKDEVDDFVDKRRV